VIAGEAEAVKVAAQAIEALGAKVRMLPVSAPFHCSLMVPAEERLAPELLAASFSTPRMPIYASVDAAPVTTPDAARDALRRQVSRPVRWQQTVERMVADGATLFVEFGSGKALTGMIKRIAKDVQRVNVEAPKDFEAARAAIAAHR
jgi:[acyl-carrier-protein] S-malonyltransferase